MISKHLKEGFVATCLYVSEQLMSWKWKEGKTTLFGTTCTVRDQAAKTQVPSIRNGTCNLQAHCESKRPDMDDMQRFKLGQKKGEQFQNLYCKIVGLNFPAFYGFKKKFHLCRE